MYSHGNHLIFEKLADREAGGGWRGRSEEAEERSSRKWKIEREVGEERKRGWAPVEGRIKINWRKLGEEQWNIAISFNHKKNSNKIWIKITQLNQTILSAVITWNYYCPCTTKKIWNIHHQALSTMANVMIWYPLEKIHQRNGQSLFFICVQLTFFLPTNNKCLHCCKLFQSIYLQWCIIYSGQEFWPTYWWFGGRRVKLRVSSKRMFIRTLENVASHVDALWGFPLDPHWILIIPNESKWPRYRANWIFICITSILSNWKKLISIFTQEMAYFIWLLCGIFLWKLNRVLNTFEKCSRE